MGIKLKINSLFFAISALFLSSCNASTVSEENTTSNVTSTTSSPIVSTHSHPYGGHWKVRKEPSLTTTGTIVKQCTICNGEVESIIPVLNDKDYTYSHVESTCSVKGVDTYVYIKDDAKFEFEVSFDYDNDNHVEVDDECYCKECNRYLGLTFGGYSIDSEWYAGSVCFVTDIGYKTEDGKKHSIKDVVIPQYVTKDSIRYVVGGIKPGAFKNCTSLESIVIPNTINSIGFVAFEIEYSAFSGCISLKKITMNKGIRTIDSWAFDGCTSLESITIPNFVKTIGNFVFQDCTSLKSIYFPSGIQEMGGGLFANCNSLENITISDDAYSSYSVKNYAIIKKNLLVAGTNKTIIPDNITTIGENAFYGWTSLQTIDIPSSVTTIENYAFSNCTSLQKVDIPDSVTTLGFNIFMNCDNLIYILIPTSIESIWSQSYTTNVFVKGTFEEVSEELKEKLYDTFKDNLFYYSEKEPTDATHSYWHYEKNNVPVKW